MFPNKFYSCRISRLSQNEFFYCYEINLTGAYNFLYVGLLFLPVQVDFAKLKVIL